MTKGRIALPKGRPPSASVESTWFEARMCMPDTPDDLNGEGLREWHRLEPFLTALNRVSRLDAQALYNYCLYWGRFSDLMQRHFTEGESLVADGPSCEILHPLLPELIGYAREMMTIASEFGLTARSRDLEGDHHNRIPTELKRLYGNRSKVADSKLAESILPMLPDWDESDLVPPPWMAREAVEIYESVTRELRNVDLFTPVDKIHMCCLACLAELTKRADSELRDDYVPVLNKKTGDVQYQKAHPLHKGIRELGKISREYWTAYGMTPRARKIFGNEQPAEKKVRPMFFKGKQA